MAALFVCEKVLLRVERQARIVPQKSQGWEAGWSQDEPGLTCVFCRHMYLSPSSFVPPTVLRRAVPCCDPPTTGSRAWRVCTPL